MRKLAVTIGSIAIAQSIWHLVTAPPPVADGIGGLISAYRSIAMFLPPHGVVGYLETSPDPDFNTVNYYVAEQALAPRILSREATATADIVITTTGSQNEASSQTPVGLTLMATGPSNIRVFRRQP